MTGFFDHLPLWEIFVGTAGLIYFCIEAGIQLGRKHVRAKSELESTVSMMAASTAGLLAFMLAVTYGAAASRHDERKHWVVRETNAIESTYLRAGLLPETSRDRVRALLREYVDIRLNAVQMGMSLENVLKQSEALQQALWAQAEAAGQKYPSSIIVGLFIQSLNDLLDIHLERLTVTVRNRIPWTSWAALYFLAALTMFLMGYRVGLSSSRSHLASLALVLAFSTVLFLIADLDRPQEGLIRVSQQVMIELQQRIHDNTSVKH